ncbi:hypothetical protein PMIN04_006171 [Paraphaeosphaeria minitans]
MAKSRAWSLEPALHITFVCILEFLFLTRSHPQSSQATPLCNSTRIWIDGCIAPQAPPPRTTTATILQPPAASSRTTTATILQQPAPASTPVTMTTLQLTLATREQ